MSNQNVIHKRHRSGAWYTPLHLRQKVQRVLRRIDLDPCTHASNPMGAGLIYTVRDSAFKHDWAAELADRCDRKEQATINMWMNPPFGRSIQAWLDRWHQTIAELGGQGFIVRGLLLVPARTETAWYREATWHRAQATCELAKRLRFERLDHGRFKAGEQARWGCALVYYGPERGKMAARLRTLGNVRMGKKWVGPPIVDPRQTVFPFTDEPPRLRCVS